MYLPAISIGYAVPEENFDAAVHSVFSSALNLRLDRENNLLTMVAASEDDLPQGIRLDTPEHFSFEGFQVGEPAMCRDGILSFERSSLTVQLSGARRWMCDLPSLRCDINNPAVSAAWSLVWDSLNKRQRRSGAEIIAEELLNPNASTQSGVSHRVSEAVRNLLNATRRCELTDSTVVSTLIGLGPGLTPSGDDLLIGYMAGLWCTARGKSELLQFIASLGETITRFSGKTNDISRTYLYHAAGGQVSSRLAHLAAAICRGENPEHLPEIAEAAMKVGHTSGMDTVMGLLIGLTCLLDMGLLRP